MTAFDALFVPADVREAVSGRAWLEAMLEAERALAAAAARAGVVPAAAAEAIADACDPEGFTWEELLEQGRAVGNPVEPLVRALRARVGGEHERFVHAGATSQDVLDTAAMLVARGALAHLLAHVDAAADGSAALARAHRSTPMAARTLLQQAVPTTFGLVAAGWLVALLDARARLFELARRDLAVQLGGAGGTLAALGDSGLRTAEELARELDLSLPTLPWHTNRVRIAELGAALGTAAGVCGKIGLDVVLLSQTEVGEVREGAVGGGSSTMPQKRNPVRATLARACARLAAGHAGVLQGALEQEHERAAGAWHAEWAALCGVLAFAGGAAAAAASSLSGLEVDAARMRANLDVGRGVVLAERVAGALAEPMGRGPAHELVASAAGAADFREALLAEPSNPFGADELDELLDPLGYLGSAEALVDRALVRYETEGGS